MDGIIYRGTPLIRGVDFNRWNYDRPGYCPLIDTRYGKFIVAARGNEAEIMSMLARDEESGRRIHHTDILDYLYRPFNADSIIKPVFREDYCFGFFEIGGGLIEIDHETRRIRLDGESEEATRYIGTAPWSIINGCMAHDLPGVLRGYNVWITGKELARPFSPKAREWYEERGFVIEATGTSE